MSDLQIAPPPERSVIPAVLIALLVLAAIAAAVFYFNPHKVADLKVTSVQTFAPHTEMKGLTPDPGKGNMRVLNGTIYTAAEDDLYLVTTVSFTDRLRIPIYLEGAFADVTFADGSQAQAHMLSVKDVQRLGAIFPTVATLSPNPIADDAEIDPGASLTGTLVLAFPGRTADAWSKKRSGTLTLELRNQEPQTARLP